MSTLRPVRLQLVVSLKNGNCLILFTVSSGTPFTITKFRVRFDFGFSIALRRRFSHARLSRLPGIRRARAPDSSGMVLS